MEATMNEDIVRVIEWYEIDGDELVGEEEVHGLTPATMTSLFGHNSQDPLFYNKYEIDNSHVSVIEQFVAKKIDLKKYVYLLACYRKD
jgi:hypothetical protein